MLVKRKYRFSFMYLLTIAWQVPYSLEQHKFTLVNILPWLHWTWMCYFQGFFPFRDVTEYMESFCLLCCLQFKACTFNSCFPLANCCVASGCQVQWSSYLSLRKTCRVARFPLSVTSVACDGRQRGGKRENIYAGSYVGKFLRSTLVSTGRMVGSGCRPLETGASSGLGLFTMASTHWCCFKEKRTLSPLSKRVGRQNTCFSWSSCFLHLERPCFAFTGDN